MKRITFLLCFVLITKLTFAQQEINNSFTSQMNALFGQLDKNQIPDGILLDYGMEFTNLAEFNGVLSERNHVTLGRLEEVYKTLLTSKINSNTNSLVTPTVFKNNLKTHRTRGVVALSGLYFKYAKLKDNALSSNLINYSNGKFYDIANKIPYETKQTFAMTPAIQKYSGFNLQVKIPSAVFYSNYSNQVQSIQIDFSNGNGYVSVPFNQNISVNYTTKGLKTWKYKLNLTNGSSLLSHSEIKIEKGYETYVYGSQNQQRTASTGVSRYPSKKITATESYSGKKASVNLTIDLANGHSQITKPLIVAEGFDVGVILSPENEYGFSGYSEFRESIRTSNSSQLRNLIYDYYKDYDIIYIDWDNGVDYLQRNAYALEEVIKWVNQQKAIAGSNEQNVVLGQSMGGVIGRWALADMEERGLNHDTRLFISHDAPQQGANVPIAIQYAYRHIQNQFINTSAGVLVSLFSDIEEPFKLLDTPASKQLLKNRATSNYGLENSLHTSFYNELKSKGLNGSNGYSINTRNIAISNGSECGSTQDFVAGSDLFQLQYDKKLSFLQNIIAPFVSFLGAPLLGDIDLWGVTVLSLFPGSSHFNTDFWAKSIPYGTGNQIYKGKISYTKKILWLISVTTNITNINKNQPSGVLPFDSYGGGYYPITENLNSTSLLPSGVYLRDKFSFIPTASALDIGKNTVSLNDADYLRSYVGGNPPTGSKSSPFANFSSDFDINPNIQNKPHISFNPRNGDWLAKELIDDSTNTAISNCAFLCNNTGISGSDIICTGDVRFSVGYGAGSYTWTIKNQQNVNVISGLNSSYLILSKKSGKSGFITLKVEIDGGDCGISIQEKEVYVGGPKFKNVQEVSVSQINHLMPYSSGGCGDFGLKLNFEPNNNNVQQIEWRKITNNFQWSQENNTNPDEYVIISPYCNELIQFEVRAKNECGWSGWQRVVYNATICNNNCSSSGNTSGINSTNFDVFPVPASSNLTVKVKNVAPSILMNGEIFKITLYNKVYRITKRVNGIANSISTDVSSLPTGSYILTIQYNSIYESHTILID